MTCKRDIIASLKNVTRDQIGSKHYIELDVRTLNELIKNGMSSDYKLVKISHISLWAEPENNFDRVYVKYVPTGRNYSILYNKFNDGYVEMYRTNVVKTTDESVIVRLYSNTIIESTWSIVTKLRYRKRLPEGVVL